MRPIIIFALMSILLIPSMAIAEDDDWSINVNGIMGWKKLDKAWSPVATQGELGVAIDFKQDDWPASVTFEMIASSDTSVNSSLIYVAGRTFQLNMGAKMILGQEETHPHMGAGVSLSSMSMGSLFGRERCEGDGAGLWVSGGVYWTLWNHFNIGPSIKYSNVDIDYRCHDGSTGTIDAGGTHYNLLLGYHW
jgi:hypothetical protein